MAVRQAVWWTHLRRDGQPWHQSVQGPDGNRSGRCVVPTCAIPSRGGHSMGVRFVAGCVAAALSVAAGASCTSGSRAAGDRPVASLSTHGLAAARADIPAACGARNLGASFQAGGYGGGNDFGSIEIWNSGTSPCRLAGTVTFIALFADGA